jgi:hypothetical protein
MNRTLIMITRIFLIILKINLEINKIIIKIEI